MLNNLTIVRRNLKKKKKRRKRRKREKEKMREGMTGAGTKG